MRKILWAAPALLLAILMVLACGCSEKTGSGGGDGGGNQVGQVQIIATDTLRYVPGDSASAPVTVVVSDLDGNVMAGRKVSVSLDNPTLGFLQFVNPSLRDTTNDFGRVDLLYTSVNRAGNNIIRAICEGVQAEAWPIVVQENTSVICNLTLNLSRDFLQVPVGLQDTITVAIRITDCSNIGIPNVAVPIGASGGALSVPPVTDASGYTSTIWYTNFAVGRFGITANAGNFSVSDSVEVVELASQGRLLVWTEEPYQVYANGCVSPKQIFATLWDQSNTAVVGDTIFFSSFGGAVDAYGVTNSQGTVDTLVYFCDVGVPSEIDSALVIARYPEWGLYDTLRIWVAPALAIGDVNLSLSTNIGVAGVDSAAVSINVFYENGTRVSGLPITFWPTCGSFTYEQDTLVNGTVSPTNYYRFCNTITEPPFSVSIWAVVGNNLATSDTIPIIVNPGEPRQIFIDNARSPINTNDTTAVWAYVLDSLNNHVRNGIPVIFTTTTGTINPGSPDVAATDPFGVAHAVLSSGPSAGQAIVKASLGFGFDEDSTVIGIISGEAANIQIDVSNTSPQVDGTGGIEFSQLYATVNDAHGNPVPDGQWVTFEILFGLPGGGVNINEHGLIDSAQTASGTATATLNSGTQAGPVLVEARTTILDEGGNPIILRARHSGITIVAGPPSNINMHPNQVGVDAGGAAWELEISIEVLDMWSNPVRDGTSIFLTIIPDTAQIVSDSVFTGNEDINGDQRHGIAYALMRYESPATFQEVIITAITGGNPPASEEIIFILPLQEPELSLYLIPDHWDFSLPGQTDSRVECRSHLVDGHAVPINGATIVYGSQRGTFRDAPTGGNVQNTAITGPNGDPAGLDGETSLWLRGPVTDFFIDDVSRETTCEVTIEVLGYPAATDQDLVNYRRELGPN